MGTERLLIEGLVFKFIGDFLKRNIKEFDRLTENDLERQILKALKRKSNPEYLRYYEAAVRKFSLKHHARMRASGRFFVFPASID